MGDDDDNGDVDATTEMNVNVKEKKTTITGAPRRRDGGQQISELADREQIEGKKKGGDERQRKREGDVAREDARTAVRCTVFAFAFARRVREVGNERERPS